MEGRAADGDSGSSEGPGVSQCMSERRTAGPGEKSTVPREAVVARLRRSSEGRRIRRAMAELDAAMNGTGAEDGRFDVVARRARRVARGEANWLLQRYKIVTSVPKLLQMLQNC
jgi:hypothetical protein